MGRWLQNDLKNSDVLHQLFSKWRPAILLQALDDLKIEVGCPWTFSPIFEVQLLPYVLVDVAFIASCCTRYWLLDCSFQQSNLLQFPVDQMSWCHRSYHIAYIAVALIERCCKEGLSWCYDDKSKWFCQSAPLFAYKNIWVAEHMPFNKFVNVWHGSEVFQQMWDCATGPYCFALDGTWKQLVHSDKEGYNLVNHCQRADSCFPSSHMSVCLTKAPKLRGVYLQFCHRHLCGWGAVGKFWVIVSHDSQVLVTWRGFDKYFKATDCFYVGCFRSGKQLYSTFALHLQCVPVCMGIIALQSHIHPYSGHLEQIQHYIVVKVYLSVMDVQQKSNDMKGTICRRAIPLEATLALRRSVVLFVCKPFFGHTYELGCTIEQSVSPLDVPSLKHFPVWPLFAFFISLSVMFDSFFLLCAFVPLIKPEHFDSFQHFPSTLDQYKAESNICRAHSLPSFLLNGLVIPSCFRGHSPDW